ncbi:MAG: hypothetical protein ACLRFJ_01720 [Alphaproteobacteria bacterium]
MKMINMDWMKSFVEPTQEELHKNVISVTADVESKGQMLYHNLEKRINDFQGKVARCGLDCDLKTALKHCITKDVCKYVSYDALYRLLFKDECSPISDIDTYQFIKKLYMRQLAITDEHTLEMAEKYKISWSFYYSPFSNNMWYRLTPVWSKCMTIEDKDSLKKRKEKERIRERKEAKRKKFEEGNPPMTREQTKAFKKALEKRPISSKTPVPEPQRHTVECSKS